MRRAIGILIKYLISPRDLRARVMHSGHNERRSLAAGSLFKVWRVRSLKFAPSGEVRRHGRIFPRFTLETNELPARIFTSFYESHLQKHSFLKFASRSEFTSENDFFDFVPWKPSIDIFLEHQYILRRTEIRNCNETRDESVIMIILCFTSTILLAGVTVPLKL